MEGYMTGQRKLLLAYLKNNVDRPLTARAIAEALKDDGVSLSAVYRNLTALENDGIISRTAGKTSRESFYQFIDPESCRDCLHLTCTGCGKIFHMKHSTAQTVIGDIADSDGFSVDCGKTVLYGLCKNCKK